VDSPLRNPKAKLLGRAVRKLGFITPANRWGQLTHPPGLQFEKISFFTFTLLVALSQGVFPAFQHANLSIKSFN